MENRKTPEADLATKRPLFLNLGLVVAISLTIVAFEWRSVIEPIEIGEPQSFDNSTEVIFVPNTVVEPRQPPKPAAIPPKVILITDIKETKDENPGPELPNPDISFDPTDATDVLKNWKMEDEVAPEAPRDIVEERALFPGGDEALNKFLSQNLKYPKKAKDRNVQGTAYARFVIDVEGNISNIEVIKGLGFGIDEEIIRVLKSSPKWKPARYSYRAVAQRLVIPVKFHLHELQY